MQLSIQDLLTISQMPDTEKLTLQNLALFYEEHLCNRQFVYRLKHKQQELRLRFKPGDLCHLLGIQHIINSMDYSGERGFNSMKNGMLTFELLEQANSGGYAAMLHRMLCFPFSYQLIHDPIIVLENAHDTKSIVKARFVFFNQYGNKFVELRIRQEKKDNPHFFVPVTFTDLRKPKNRTKVTINEFIITKYDDGYPT